MSNENAITPAQEGTAPPAEIASTAVDQVTSDASPQEGNRATPDSESLRLKKAQETRERIEELSARARAGQEYGEFYRQRFEELQQKQSQQPAPVQVEQPEPEPDADVFDDPKEFTKAYAAWSRRETEKAIKRATEQAQTEAKSTAEKAMASAREQERLKSLNDQFAVKSHQFAEKNADYMTTISNPALTFMNGDFLEALKASEKGPELAYHIAKSPQLVARLAGKSVPQRLAELGRIEAELSRPAPPPKVTTAPAPPTPIGGSSAGGEPDPSKMPVKDWMEWRSKQLLAKRQAR